MVAGGWRQMGERGLVGIEVGKAELRAVPDPLGLAVTEQERSTPRYSCLLLSWLAALLNSSIAKSRLLSSRPDSASPQGGCPSGCCYGGRSHQRLSCPGAGRHLSGSVRTLLDETTLPWLARGCGVLGTGGGGDPSVGLMMALQAVGDFGPTPLIGLDELDDEALIMPCGSVGAPTVASRRSTTVTRAVA